MAMLDGTNYSNQANDSSRLKKYYSGKASKSLSDFLKSPDKAGQFHAWFSTPSEFVTWWRFQFEKQYGRCHYCKSKFELIAEMIEKGCLGKRLVRGNGYRGKYPEIDRIASNEHYSTDNCVLACYPCNNDKSYVYLDNKWADFIGPARKNYFEYLANEVGLMTDEQP